MTWTDIARQEHGRKWLRYPSDMTDREWLLTASFIPPAKSGGRKRTSDMRDVLNAVLYVDSSGRAWRMLLKCFPPVSTVRRYFYVWRNIRLFANINTLLVMNLREIEGLQASPSAGITDRQSVKPLKVAEFAALTPARRSRDASATFSPTPAASPTP